MTEQEVVHAAQERADALRLGDGEKLGRLLHPKFCWTSHKGQRLDRSSYLTSNIEGQNTWHAQILEQPKVTVIGDTAVLTCTVTDEVSTAEGKRQYRMPMTQVWTKGNCGWVLLAGHAGPLL